MSEHFPTLFSPLQLRHKTLKNRIVFGAHTANMSHEGIPGPRHFGYYRERARGGAAMIVIEPSPAHRTGILTRGNFLHESDAVIPHFRKITDACHSHGTVMIHQIYHVGGHGDQDNSWEPYWSPSGVPSFHDPWGSHAMTEAEVEELIAAFVEAARRDRDAGFDGVDLFAGYNCLIDQFWSPLTNKRTDRWGGSLENRLRFTVEVASRIRKMAGDDFIIGMTISGGEPYPGGLSLADKQEIVSWLDQRGLDRLLLLRHRQLSQPVLQDRAKLPFRHVPGPRRCGGHQAGGEARQGHHGGAGENAGQCRGRAQRRKIRPCVDRARTDRRSASGQQGEGGAGRGYPALHLLQPALHRPALPRLLYFLPDQSVGVARA